MESEQFKSLQRSINEATEHAQGERDLETTEVESDSPASGVAGSYTAPTAEDLNRMYHLVMQARSEMHDGRTESADEKLSEVQEKLDHFVKRGAV